MISSASRLLGRHGDSSLPGMVPKPILSRLKATQLDPLGAAEVMELREVPLPQVRPGTVLVRNHVVAINYGDTFFLRGTYLVTPKFPDTPGVEAAGVIAAVTPDVKGLKIGMLVAYIGMGSLCRVHAHSPLARHGDS